MKKKLLASLLVGSAVVGASLAPLSAQATTTGKTPVTVGFEGGTLPEQDNNDGSTTAPEPGTPNTDFDILAIPKAISVGSLKIGEDLSNIGGLGIKSLAIGDLRGTKEGWHLTGEIKQMKNGTDSLDGSMDFSLKISPASFFEPPTSSGGYYIAVSMSGVDPTTVPDANGTSMKFGGGATPLITADVGKGQGMWLTTFQPKLNITTPTQQLKKGNYTGNITWNLVAGPSTPAPAPGPAN